MRSKAKKLLITTETHEIFIVRVSCHEGVNGFCPDCEAEVELMTVDSAVSALGISGREVIRRITSDEIHSIETADGHLLVCKSSLGSGRESAEVKGNIEAVASGYGTEDDQNV